MANAPFIECRAQMGRRVQRGRVVAAKKASERIEPEIGAEVVGIVGCARLLAKLPRNRSAQSGTRADIQRKRNPGGVAARKQRSQIVDGVVGDGKAPSSLFDIHSHLNLVMPGMVVEYRPFASGRIGGATSQSHRQKSVSWFPARLDCIANKTRIPRSACFARPFRKQRQFAGSLEHRSRVSFR
jgi:hypothetical protein